MRFLRYLVEIVLSCVNPFFSRKIVRYSAFSAISYFFFFTTLYGFAAGGIVSSWIWKRYDSLLAAAGARLPDIKIEMAGGQLSVDLPQPSVTRPAVARQAVALPTGLGNHDFGLPMGDVFQPAGMANSLPGPGTETPPEIKGLIDALGGMSGLNGLDSGALLPKAGDFLKNTAFSMGGYRFTNIPDFSLNKGVLIEKLKVVKKQAVTAAFLVLSLLVFPSVWLGVLPLMPVVAVPFLIFAKIIRAPIGYGKVFSICLYTLTLPIIVQTCLSFARIDIPGLTILIYALWTAIAIAATHDLARE